MKRDRDKLVWLDFTLIVFCPFGVFSWGWIKICWGHLETFSASSKDLLPEAFVYRKLMPDIFCHQEPQIQIKCLKSAKFFTRRCIFPPSFYVPRLILWFPCPFVLRFFLPTKRWYTKCRTSELAKGRATATPPTSNHTTKHSCVIFCSPGSCWFFGLIRFKLESNRLISSKESQLKHQVDTLALACAFCYGIVIPCCLLYLYGKQHMVWKWTEQEPSLDGIEGEAAALISSTKNLFLVTFHPCPG